MKNLIKKMFMLTSVLGAVVLMSGCTTMCGQKKTKPQQHNRMMQQQQQPTETVVFYQTYEDADITHVEAKMYTHSSHGGESRMGNIKFVETDAGLKMEVDVTDLRPGKVYTMKIYPCSKCDSGMCCNKSPMQMNMPTLSVTKPGRLKESFIIQGLTAEQLNNAKLYLERDGGYKAAWGTLKKGMML